MPRGYAAVSDAAVAAELAPTRPLRASINVGNPIIAGAPLSSVCSDAARESYAALLAGTSTLHSWRSSRRARRTSGSPSPRSVSLI